MHIFDGRDLAVHDHAAKRVGHGRLGGEGGGGTREAVGDEALEREHRVLAHKGEALAHDVVHAPLGQTGSAGGELGAGGLAPVAAVVAEGAAGLVEDAALVASVALDAAEVLESLLASGTALGGASGDERLAHDLDGLGVGVGQRGEEQLEDGLQHGAERGLHGGPDHASGRVGDLVLHQGDGVEDGADCLGDGVADRRLGGVDGLGRGNPAGADACANGVVHSLANLVADDPLGAA